VIDESGSWIEDRSPIGPRCRISALMRKLVYFVATTIDGCIAGPEGQFDFFTAEGDHIAAQCEELPETLPVPLRAKLGVEDRQARFDTVLMGWATYQPALAVGLTDPYAPLETIVFSRKQPPRTEGTLRVTAEDPTEVARALKAKEGRDVWLCGGATLATALRAEIDELIVKVNPVIAGDGIRLFAGPFEPRDLTLRARRGFESGVTWLTYERAR
jgi:dihydrofolate reductase